MRPGPIRARADFAALNARGRRSRRHAVRVTYLPGDDGVRVAYAVGRPAGPAVRRNRLRRRLRAVVAGQPLAQGSYLLAAGAEAAALSSDELRAVVAAALDEVTAG